MFTVYILQNELNNKYYIGSTSNFSRRFIEHNRGQTLSTRRKGKWILKYSEVFQNKIEAIRREKQIKSYKGRNAFKKLIAGVVYR